VAPPVRPRRPSGVAARAPAGTPTLTTAQQRAVAELLRVAPVIDDLGRRLAAAGHQLHLVGGSVRDALLGRLGNDLDFATDARPEQVLALARGWAEATWETGISFGTVGLARHGFRLEVTTYRSEAYDRSSRNPQVRYGESLAEDLARRDFTVNAMAVSLPDHVFTDPHDGLTDLANGVLRTPGRPEDSFDDDPLRMLRAARFVSQLGFAVDGPVVAAATAMADRLAIVTAERKQAELSKLLLGARPTAGLELMVATDLAEHVVPELPGMRLEIDPLHQHKDVYAHTLAVLERAIGLEPDGADLTLRMAALLHDIGKPRTRAKEPGGGVSFHHHEVVGASMARKRLKALRYPKAFTEDVATLVELHLRFHGYGKGQWTDSAVRRYVHDAGPLLDRLNRLVRSDCTTRNRGKAAALSAAYDDLEDRIARLREQEEIDALRPDLDGAAVMNLLGIPPGPLVGQALRHLLELRTERGPLDYETAVAELHRWAVEAGVRPPAG